MSAGTRQRSAADRGREGNQASATARGNPTALDVVFIVFTSVTLLLFLLWVVTSLAGQAQFTDVPMWLKKIVSSAWAKLSLLGGSVGIFVLRKLFDKSPAPNYLVWIPGFLLFLLAVLFGVWFLVRTISANPRPAQRPNPVEDLIHQVDHLRGDFEASPANKFLRLKVNNDAARVASQAEYINDAALDLANRIAKYEYGAYAFVMAASTDTNPAQGQRFVRSSLNLCDQARVALRELDGRRATGDEEANRARVWAMEDHPKDRVAFLATMAWCVDYSITHKVNSRQHARKEWAQVSGSFRDEYKDNTPELVNCVSVRERRER